MLSGHRFSLGEDEKVLEIDKFYLCVLLNAIELYA